MPQRINRIAVMTGGGDAPGLNAVIRSVTITALANGWQCIGIRDSYDGLLAPEQYPHGGTVNLTRESVRGITHLVLIMIPQQAARNRSLKIICSRNTAHGSRTKSTVSADRTCEADHRRFDRR